MRYFVQDTVRFLRDYKLFGSRHPAGHTVYFVMDPKMHHPGMVDRFKAIVCVNYIAKVNGFDFKIVRNSDFPIWEYLGDERQYADFLELSPYVGDSRLFSYNGGVKRVPRLCKSVSQYHVYNFIGLDFLQNCFQADEWKKVWRDSFNEVFKLLPKASALLESVYCSFPAERTYVAVHLRFVNALEQFEEGYSNSLSQSEKDALLALALRALDVLKKRHADKTLVVFSDSNVFLKKAEEAGYEIPPKFGNLGHISFDPSALEKALIDFFLISKSSKAYSVRGGKLYTSEFSKYAAIAGGADYATENIDLL